MTYVLMVVMQSGQDWCKLFFSCLPFAPFLFNLVIDGLQAKISPHT